MVAVLEVAKSPPPPGRELKRYNKLGSLLISPIMSFIAWRSSLVMSSSLVERESSLSLGLGCLLEGALMFMLLLLDAELLRLLEEEFILSVVFFLELFLEDFTPFI